jgi:hypothetical protein
VSTQTNDEVNFTHEVVAHERRVIAALRTLVDETMDCAAGAVDSVVIPSAESDRVTRIFRAHAETAVAALEAAELLLATPVWERR